MSIDHSGRRIYRFREFFLDLDRETLFCGDHEIQLRPKSFTILTILLEHAGRLVTKRKFYNAAWQGSAVTDDSLAHCIAEIRRALGKDGFEIIRTVPRRGYILDCAVSQEVTPQLRGPRKRLRPPTRAAVITVALLGTTIALFGVGRGDRGADGAFVDGVAQRNEGFAAGESLSANPDARSAWQKGRFFFNRRGEGDLDRAEASFNKALDLDSSFGAAWASLAGVYSVRYGAGLQGRDEALPLLADTTSRAVSLAPESAEAHIRRAFYFRTAGQRLDADHHMNIAVELAPNDALVLGVQAGRHACSGRLDEAIDLQLRAVQVDPTSALQHHNLAAYLLAAGRVAEALVQVGHYRALKPGANDADDLFVDALILQGRHEQALTKAHGIASDLKRDRSLAIIYHELGQADLASAALTRLMKDEDELAMAYVAEVLAQRGEVEQAIHLLSGITTSPDGHTTGQLGTRRRALSLLSPFLIELRDDARWQALHAMAVAAYDDAFFVARSSSQTNPDPPAN